MNHADAVTCRDYVASIFDKWTPHEDELGVWLASISRIACSVDRWKAAVLAAHGETRYHTPLLAEIRTKLQQVPAGQDEPTPEDPIVHSGWWLVRRGTTDCRELLLRRGDPTYDEHCRRLCLAWLHGDQDNAGLEQMYPGEWMTVGPGCKSWADACRAVSPEFEERYQKAWEWACAKMGPPQQSADDWFAERAGKVAI